jgi:hypothetical protein
MARRTEDFELDPAVVLIPDHYELSMDDWLRSLRRGKPSELPTSGAELVEEARNESE